MPEGLEETMLNMPKELEENKFNNARKAGRNHV
jgi:hypothetical protein